MHFAVKNNNNEMVKTLIQKAELNIKNKEGLTPIDIASKYKYGDVYNILVEEFNSREEKAKTNSKEIYDEVSKKEKKEKVFTAVSISENTNSIQSDIYDRDENDDFSEDNTSNVYKINDNLQGNAMNMNQKMPFDGNYNNSNKNIQYPNYYPNQNYVINNMNQMQGFYGGPNMTQNYPSSSINNFQGQNFSKKGQNFTGNNYNSVTNSNTNKNLFHNNPSNYSNSNFNYNPPNMTKKNNHPAPGINLHLSDNNKVVVTQSIPKYSNYSINIPFDFNYKKIKGEYQQHSSNQLGEYISNYYNYSKDSGLAPH